MNPPRNVAIVGIAGIGKEHARVLTERGIAFTLVDFPEVLVQEAGGGVLRNTYPGFEFELPLPKGVRTLPLSSVDHLKDLGVTDVILATPHTKEGRHWVSVCVSQNLPVLVEKPLYIEMPAYYPVYVNYIYYGTATPLPTKSVVVACPHPDKDSWRLDLHGPVLWELLPHALSVLSDDQVGNLFPTVLDPNLFIGEAGDVKVEAFFTDNSDHYGLRIDGELMDWHAAFDESVGSFLDGHTNLDKVLEIEGLIRAFEMEI